MTDVQLLLAALQREQRLRVRAEERAKHLEYKLESIKQNLRINAEVEALVLRRRMCSWAR